MKLKYFFLIVFLISITDISFGRDTKEKIKEEIKTYCENLPFEMPELTVPDFPDREFKITDFGAVGDGIFSNTEAFRKAIEACSKSGGGKVIVTSGIWLTGPITFQSNINLYLEKGAYIQFSSNFDDYPLIKTTYEGTEQYRCISPINGKDLTNIAITGYGVIDGAGDAWRYVKKYKLTENQWKELVASGGVVDASGETWWPSENALKGEKYFAELQNKKDNLTKEDFQPIRDYLRPVMVNFTSCKNIMLDGPTFQDSPAWNIHPLMCENVIVRNITVRNPWYSQNGDGIDVESCKNVLIYGCRFDVGDDAICMKSGKNEFGRKRGMPTENVVIADCIVYHGHGGFTIGSEMSGGVRNIKVSNCNFIGTDMGIRFKSTRGRGGIVENIYFNDIYMNQIPTTAIGFNMFYSNKAPKESASPEVESQKAEAFEVSDETPVFRKTYLNNIICNGAEDAVILQGLPEMPISEIELTNVTITSKKGVSIFDASDITIKNSKFYPDESPVFLVSQCKDVELNKIQYEQDIPLFIKAIGNKTDRLKISGTMIHLPNNKIELGQGLNKNVIRIE